MGHYCDASGLQFSAQGSTDPDGSGGAGFWEGVLTAIAFSLTRFCIVVGACLMFSMLTKVIYSDCEVGDWPKEHLLDSINLAFFIKGKETGEEIRSFQS